jgi:hypothetical protein
MIRVIYLESDDAREQGTAIFSFSVPFSKNDFILVSMGEYYAWAAKGLS